MEKCPAKTILKQDHRNPTKPIWYIFAWNKPDKCGIRTQFLEMIKQISTRVSQKSIGG
jgi:hypothetical protein